MINLFADNKQEINFELVNVFNDKIKKEILEHIKTAVKIQNTIISIKPIFNPAIYDQSYIAQTCCLDQIDHVRESNKLIEEIKNYLRFSRHSPNLINIEVIFKKM
ncbi:MAG: hypothetical protein LC122_12245 [Chitinophagales bacterium]|nr:hypothetical protein [Chitinophagales bacterium]